MSMLNSRYGVDFILSEIKMPLILQYMKRDLQRQNCLKVYVYVFIFFRLNWKFK